MESTPVLEILQDPHQQLQSSSSGPCHTVHRTGAVLTVFAPGQGPASDPEPGPTSGGTSATAPTDTAVKPHMLLLKMRPKDNPGVYLAV